MAKVTKARPVQQSDGNGYKVFNSSHLTKGCQSPIAKLNVYSGMDYTLECTWHTIHYRILQVATFNYVTILTKWQQIFCKNGTHFFY